MNTLMNFILVVPCSAPQTKTPMLMNNNALFIVEAIVAILLLIYLIITLIKPDKF